MLIPFLLKEKIVPFSAVKKNPTSVLRGFVRVVKDADGLATKGFYMDRNTFGDFLEYLQYSSPSFWEEIEKSRKSGRISLEEIKKEFSIK